jgi:hypothetical protein
VEREVEEILRKLDDFVPERPTPIRSRGRSLKRAGRNFGGRLPRISWTTIILSILLVALIFFFAPGFSGGTLIVFGIVGAFFLYFLLTRRRPLSPPPEKRWRGQPLDLSRSAEPNWTDRLRGRLKGGKR